jgi:ubiquinone/menaquinone biosynthesis C-methylase UbiE
MGREKMRVGYFVSVLVTAASEPPGQEGSRTMNYDETAIADTYDAARSHTRAVMRQWLDLVAAHLPFAPQLIVDVGCGTGRFSQPLADRFTAKVIGVDRSQRMLAVARTKCTNGRVEFRLAPAERLPLADGGADLVFMSMVLHHLPDKQAAARECCRILRAGGRFCMRTSTRDIIYPQSQFFPGILPMLKADLPSAAEIITLFEAAGLKCRTHQLVTQTLASDWQQFADKLAVRADSFLARLPDEAFAAGMAKLRAHAAQSPAQRITEPIDFFVFER